VIVEPHEIPNLISAAAEGPHYFGVMVFAALFSGMRLGELQGLRWDDVHIHGQNKAKPYIVVHGQLLRQKDEDTGTTVFEQRGLKSKHDHITRTLRIPRQLGDHLRRWRAASPRSTGQDFVFVSAAGSPPSDSTIRSNFYRARKAAGLNPAMRFHDMRDTHASMLIRDGRPITEIAVRLGHTKKDGFPESSHDVGPLLPPLRRRHLGRGDLRATGGARRQPPELEVDQLPTDLAPRDWLWIESDTRSDTRYFCGFRGFETSR
jgi:integrase